jgi:hypothetical protein
VPLDLCAWQLKIQEDSPIFYAQCLGMFGNVFDGVELRLRSTYRVYIELWWHQCHFALCFKVDCFTKTSEPNNPTTPKIPCSMLLNSGDH